MANDNAKLIKELKSYFKNSHIKDTKMDFILDENHGCIIRLHNYNFENKNMQLACNAFEGWACAIYEYLLYGKGLKKPKITLDISGPIQREGFLNHGHLCRFLYRALRFEEQYDWFYLSELLKPYVQEFEKFMKNSTLVNNIGKDEAGTKEKYNKENLYEEKLSRAGIMKQLADKEGKFEFGNNPVFRQLAVGLFLGEVPDERKKVFTGRKSAIDMWSWNEDCIEVIELKAEQKMIGLVTELFFYCNYICDLVLKDGLFQINKEIPNTENDRGYHYLLENEFTKVRGILLADQFHPFNGEASKVLDVLNDNGNAKIEYYRITYTKE